jgi:chromosome segregation ATPase
VEAEMSQQVARKIQDLKHQLMNAQNSSLIYKDRAKKAEATVKELEEVLDMLREANRLTNSKYRELASLRQQLVAMDQEIENDSRVVALRAQVESLKEVVLKQENELDDLRTVLSRYSGFPRIAGLRTIFATDDSTRARLDRSRK